MKIQIWEKNTMEEECPWILKSNVFPSLRCCPVTKWIPTLATLRRNLGLAIAGDSKVDRWNFHYPRIERTVTRFKREKKNGGEERKKPKIRTRWNLILFLFFFFIYIFLNFCKIRRRKIERGWSLCLRNNWNRHNLRMLRTMRRLVRLAHGWHVSFIKFCPHVARVSSSPRSSFSLSLTLLTRC